MLDVISSLPTFFLLNHCNIMCEKGIIFSHQCFLCSLYAWKFRLSALKILFYSLALSTISPLFFWISGKVSGKILHVISPIPTFVYLTTAILCVKKVLFSAINVSYLRSLYAWKFKHNAFNLSFIFRSSASFDYNRCHRLITHLEFDKETISDG